LVDDANSFVNRFMGRIARSTVSTAPMTKVGGAEDKRGRVYSTMNIVGGAVVGIGTFFPYALIVLSGTFGSETISRSAWELGSNRSITLTSGPLIVAFSLLVVFNECRFLLQRSRVLDSQFLVTRFANVIVLIVLVLLSWPGKWPAEAGTLYQRGGGGWASVGGIEVCLLSTVMSGINASSKA
jgi:hypothetical protein